jgi:hypothetical protein
MPDQTEAELLEELRAANADRAVLYYLALDELRRSCGDAEAMRMLDAIIYRLGERMGSAVSCFAPARMRELGAYHVAHSAAGGRLFNPTVRRLDDGGFEVHNATCPLKDAWQSMGLADNEVATLCKLAAAVDFGKFESAGFRFDCETWKPGQPGCCTLKVYPA